MITVPFVGKLINFNVDPTYERWWTNCVLLRYREQEWFVYQDNSYMYINYIDSIEIEEAYQKEQDGQKDLFR